MNEGSKMATYTVPELAERLGMSEKWVWKHLHDRRLPGMTRCGRAVRCRFRHGPRTHPGFALPGDNLHGSRWLNNEDSG